MAIVDAEEQLPVRRHGHRLVLADRERRAVADLRDQRTGGGCRHRRIDADCGPSASRRRSPDRSASALSCTSPVVENVTRSRLTNGQAGRRPRLRCPSPRRPSLRGCRDSRPCPRSPPPRRRPRQHDAPDLRRRELAVARRGLQRDPQRAGAVDVVELAVDRLPIPQRDRLRAAGQPIQLRLGDVAIAREVDDRDVVGRDLTLLSVHPHR